MAPGQRLSPECERNGAGADRSEFHVSLLSFEKSMRATPARPARPTCAGASVIRDGTEGSATSNSAGFCAGCSARATSALRWWGGCRSHLLIATPLSVSDRGGKQTDVGALQEYRDGPGRKESSGGRSMARSGHGPARKRIFFGRKWAKKRPWQGRAL